jgi:hypothetical protein
MKIFKKIVLSLIVLIVLSLASGYFYFDKKFTPPENKLQVSGNAENTVFQWKVSDGNSYAAVLLPVRIKGIDRTFYMQLDSGSPVTLFYKNSLASISSKFPEQIQLIKNKDQISMQFSIENMKVSSDFELKNYGSTVDSDNAGTNNIIGTIGTDLFEKRIIILDFKNELFSFVQNIDETDFESFEFKRRKIMIPGEIGGQKLKLLYDSGTSGYELLTNREEWTRYKTPKSQIKKEKGNSWGNILTVISAPADHNIKIGSQNLKLSEVTYVEGTSQMQNLLMKTSGMQGMIGNKLFLNYKLILDCKNEKFKVE